MFKRFGKMQFFYVLLILFSTSMWAQTSTADLVWDGFDPFHQPFSSTYYYGSGDIDLDGDVDREDELLLQKIYLGEKEPCIMADVDGNGTVEYADYQLVCNVVRYGDILPGWWNKLTTMEQRRSWLVKMLAIDKTDQNPYINYSDDRFYVCGHFSNETFSHFTGYRWDGMHYRHLTGGQSIFNIPMYKVSLSDHAINAVLLGDNPLVYDDWGVIEPQNDHFRSASALSNYDYLKINIPYNKGTHTSYATTMVKFVRQNNDFVHDSHSANLVTSRPQVSQEDSLNSEDRLFPKIVNDKYILFNQLRDDVTRMNDIHLGTMPLDNIASAVAITHDEEYSKLLDSCSDNKGLLHLIWRGAYPVRNTSGAIITRNFGCYYGVYDLENKMLVEKTWLGNYFNSEIDGRIESNSKDEINVFILDYHNRVIDWRVKTEGQWSEAIELADGLTSSQASDTHFRSRSVLYYTFDICINTNDDIQLCWIKGGSDREMYCREYSYAQDSWSSQEIMSLGIGSEEPLGLTLANNGTTAFLSFWTEESSSTNRGNLYIMSNSGTGWSYSQCLDNDGNNITPRLASDKRGRMVLVWDKLIGNYSEVMYRLNFNNSWTIPAVLSSQGGAFAYYPDATITKSGSIYACWSSRSEKTLEIETATIFEKPGPPVLHYDFDYIYAEDKSGYNNHGYFQGSPSVESVAGRKNQALAFSGSQIIRVPNDNSLNIGTNDYAISCWLKVPSTFNSLGEIVYKNGRYRGSSTGFSLQINQGSPRLRIEDTEKGYAKTYYDNSIKINDDQWHLLTVNVSRDSSQGVRFYIDGQLRYQGDALAKSKSLYNESDLIIGGRDSVSSYRFQGSIDELRFYNRALLSDEISTLYMDYYNCLSLDFDGQVVDLSGNGNAVSSSLENYVSGISESGIAFDDKDELVVSNSPTLNFDTNDFSISLWVSKGRGFEVQTLLDKQDQTLTDYPGFKIWITDRGNRPNINFTLGNWTVQRSISNLLDGNWHHVVYTIERGVESYLSLYVDGSRKYRYKFTKTTSASTSLPLLIGKSPSNDSHDFTGNMDELNIYNKALNYYEVQSLFQNP